MRKRYGLVIDLERCIGCQTCRIACKVENYMEIGSGIRVDTVGGEHPDTPSGKYPDLSMYYLPVPCMQCSEPVCLDFCPMEAIYKSDDGIVMVDNEKCCGCQACIDACPYDALTLDVPPLIIYDRTRKLIQKCNLCQHRVDQGLEPFCVVCCSCGAIFFGDLKDSESEVSRLIAEKSTYVLKPEAGTNPAVRYCPAEHYAPAVNRKEETKVS